MKSTRLTDSHTNWLIPLLTYTLSSLSLMEKLLLLCHCGFLFLAVFNLCPVPWQNRCNLQRKHANSIENGPIVHKLTDRLSFTQGYLKFDNQFHRVRHFQDGDQSKKMARATFEKYAVTLRILVEIASNLGHMQGDLEANFDLSYFAFGVTLRDLFSDLDRCW